RIYNAPSMSTPRRLLAITLAVLGCGAAGPTAPGGANSAPTNAPAPEIFVYAAASLKDALGALAPTCEAAAGVHFVYNYGASNDLARQIIAAGKADLFFSADEAWMDDVVREGLVDTATRRTLLSNRLAVVVPDLSHLKIVSAAALGEASVRKI